MAAKGDYIESKNPNKSEKEKRTNYRLDKWKINSKIAILNQTMSVITLNVDSHPSIKRH